MIGFGEDVESPVSKFFIKVMAIDEMAHNHKASPAVRNTVLDSAPSPPWESLRPNPTVTGHARALRHSSLFHPRHPSPLSSFPSLGPPVRHSQQLACA
jgi:hypothetical protein